MRDRYAIAVVTNDIYTREDADFLVLSEALAAERIVGVETGGCPGSRPRAAMPAPRRRALHAAAARAASRAPARRSRGRARRRARARPRPRRRHHAGGATPRRTRRRRRAPRPGVGSSGPEKPCVSGPGDEGEAGPRATRRKNERPAGREGRRPPALPWCAARESRAQVATANVSGGGRHPVRWRRHL